MLQIELRTSRLRLRALHAADIEPLTTILAEPAVARFWPDYDRLRVERELLVSDDERTVLGIELGESGGPLIGAIQLVEELGEEYRHAGIDLFIGTAWQGRGLGSEAIRAAIDFLFQTRKHHRITIDPAADNQRAIRSYERLGFRRVGLLRQYERGPDGTFHDGLLMELLACDDRGSAAVQRSTSQNLTLRLATEADVPRILSMMVAFNRFEGITWSPESGEAPLRQLLKDDSLGFIALLDTDAAPACGYAIVTFGFDLEYGGRDAFLTELFLDSSLRGQGLGRQAMELLLKKTATFAASALHLQVRPDNPQAHRLYLSAGFSSTTRVFLSKLLDAAKLSS